jgi:hypothetical protein
MIYTDGRDIMGGTYIAITGAMLLDCYDPGKKELIRCGMDNIQ